MERKPDGDVTWALHPGQDLGRSPVAALHDLTRNLMGSLQLLYGVETMKGGTEVKAVHLSGAHKRDLSPTGEWRPVLRSLSSARSEPGHSFTSLSYRKPLIYARHGCGCLEYISDPAQQTLPLGATVLIARNRKQVVNSKHVKLYRLWKVVSATGGKVK